MQHGLQDCSVRRRRGLTLIEVVAGLALLGTLLTTLLLAHSRHARQIRAAQDKLAAVNALDGLLTRWEIERVQVPQRERGDLPGHPDLGWRTRPIRNPSADNLQAGVVAIEVFSQDAELNDPPLCSVELLVPKSSPQPRFSVKPVVPFI